MAPLPPNNTACMWVDYTNGVDEHSLMVRYAGDANFADAATAVAGLFTVLTSELYLITITGARYRSAGSTITLPNTWPGATSYGSMDMPDVLGPRELRFQGRDTTGRDVSWSIYGWKGDTPANYRILLTESAVIEAAIAHIDDVSDGGSFCTIAGDVPTVYPYANVNYNSYWEKERRG